MTPILREISIDCMKPGKRQDAPKNYDRRLLETGVLVFPQLQSIAKNAAKT